jgi:hypothetical protein
MLHDGFSAPFNSFLRLWGINGSAVYPLYLEFHSQSSGIKSGLLGLDAIHGLTKLCGQFVQLHLSLPGWTNSSTQYIIHVHSDCSLPKSVKTFQFGANINYFPLFSSLVKCADLFFVKLSGNHGSNSEPSKLETDFRSPAKSGSKNTGCCLHYL